MHLLLLLLLHFLCVDSDAVLSVVVVRMITTKVSIGVTSTYAGEAPHKTKTREKTLIETYSSV